MTDYSIDPQPEGGRRTSGWSGTLPLADEVRMSFHVDPFQQEPVTQASPYSDNRRTRIRARTVTVSAFRMQVADGSDDWPWRFYVSAEGFILRLRDDGQSRVVGRIVYRWAHDYPSQQLDAAPAWLQVIAQDARARILAAVREA